MKKPCHISFDLVKLGIYNGLYFMFQLLFVSFGISEKSISIFINKLIKDSSN